MSESIVNCSFKYRVHLISSKKNIIYEVYLTNKKTPNKQTTIQNIKNLRHGAYFINYNKTFTKMHKLRMFLEYRYIFLLEQSVSKQIFPKNFYFLLEFNFVIIRNGCCSSLLIIHQVSGPRHLYVILRDPFWSKPKLFTTFMESRMNHSHLVVNVVCRRIFITRWKIHLFKSISMFPGTQPPTSRVYPLPLIPIHRESDAI